MSMYMYTWGEGTYKHMNNNIIIMCKNGKENIRAYIYMYIILLMAV